MNFSQKKSMENLDMHTSVSKETNYKGQKKANSSFYKLEVEDRGKGTDLAEMAKRYGKKIF